MAEMDYWFSDMHTSNVKISIRISKQLYSGTSEFQRIDVFDTQELGKMIVKVCQEVFHEMIERQAPLVSISPRRGEIGGNAT